jgi:SNF2 family DNA or RNA helicase
MDPDFYPAARAAVIDLGIVRRRKIDVAADIPARRIADLPVELDGAVGRSIRAAERVLARRLVRRYRSALEVRDPGRRADRRRPRPRASVAGWERQEAKEAARGERLQHDAAHRPGEGALAADYAAQLARNVGKVVFFAKHVDVMDAPSRPSRSAGSGYSSIRGDQTPRVRQQSIDAFVNDPDVAVVVCSLTAPGVGLNLQVASNVVLAELSGPTPSRRRRSTGCTGSGRTSRSRPGASSPRRRSTRGSPS